MPFKAGDKVQLTRNEGSYANWYGVVSKVDDFGLLSIELTHNDKCEEQTPHMKIMGVAQQDVDAGECGKRAGPQP